MAQLKDTTINGTLKIGNDKIDSFIKETGIKDEWHYTIYTNGIIDMWQSKNYTFETDETHLMNAGVSDMYLNYIDITLPFNIEMYDSISYVSCPWMYTEWFNSSVNNTNTVRVRKFGVYNSMYNGAETFLSIFIRGTLSN